MDFAAQELRHEETQELPENVAQGDEIEEANRMKEPLPFNVLLYLRF